MKKIDWKIYQEMFLGLKVFFDIISVGIGAVLALKIAGNSETRSEFFSPDSLRYLIVFWITISNTVFFWILRLYRQEVSFLNFEETEKIIRATFLSHMLLYPGLILFAGVSEAFSFVFMSFLISTFFISIERLIAYKIAKYNYKKERFVKRIAIYDACPAGVFILKKLTELPQLGLKPIGFIDNKLEKRSIVDTGSEEVKAQIPVLGSIENLSEVVLKHGIEELFVATPAIKSGEMKAIIDSCKKTRISYRFVPNLFEEPLYKINLYSMGNIPFIKAEDFEIRLVTKILKRMMDIVFSLAILVMISPILLLIAIIIKKDSRGPIFFSQKRIGKNGKPFMIYKFRTMKVGASKYAYSPTTLDDPRMTRFGKFLRKTSLDELPQFWNVIKNDMSIVGPRPEMPFIVKQYNAQQRERLLVKPGITGLWQVTLDRSKLIHENLDYDIYYMKNISVLLDILIIIKTVLFAARGIGAY